ncbi:MAG: ABC transporter substrate-binding protein, partial [Geminicoccaceae bacterium]|nr:ABC transporter substrate-binding protein [Geminicoccaceae bacterium]
MGASRREILLSTTALAGVALVARGRGAWAQEPVKGGTLIVAADTEPRNLNPAMVASNGVFYVSSKVVEPLVEMDYETGLRPVLATEWGGSEDGLTYTVKLREGVTFSDGTPFTSEDVAFSAMQVWKPLQNLGRVVFPNLEAVDTPDPLTAVFTFSVPTPPQLIENALPALSSVLPKHLYDGSDIAENPLNMAPVGTGPFVFAEHRPGEFIRLERNPTYWGEGQPYLDAILYRVLPDAGAKAAALETGDIHLTAFSAVPLAEMPRLDALDDVTVVDKGYEGITYQITLEINHRRAELANPLVRQALRHAIDPQFIVDVVFMGYATAATGPVPSSAADFYTADVATYDFDIAAAEALLDEAGYPRGAD